MEESDGITDFPDNSCAMPTEVIEKAQESTVDHNGARGKRRGLIRLNSISTNSAFSGRVNVKRAISVFFLLSKHRVDPAQLDFSPKK